MSCSLAGITLPHQCRATRRGTDKRRSGVADRNGAGTRSVSSAPTLVADEAKHPIGKSQPQLIGCNAPSRVECSQSGAILPMVFIPFGHGGTSATARYPLPQRCQGPSPDQHARPISTSSSPIRVIVSAPLRRHCSTPNDKMSTRRPPHSQTASQVSTTHRHNSNYTLTIQVRVSSSTQARDPVTHQLPPEAPMKQAIIAGACIIALATLGACSSTMGLCASC